MEALKHRRRRASASTDFDCGSTTHFFANRAGNRGKAAARSPLPTDQAATTPSTPKHLVESLNPHPLRRTLVNFGRPQILNYLAHIDEISHRAAPGQAQHPVKISAPSEIVFFLLVKKRGGVSKNENPTLSPNACQLRPLINPEPLGRFRRNFAQSCPWAGTSYGENFSPIGYRLLLTR